MLESRSREETPEMAERSARSLDRVDARPERRVQLRVVARSDENADGHRSLPLSAPSVPPPLLSQASDLWGIGRSGWLAAGALYVVLVAAFLIAWRVTPPEPWPAQEAVFHVIFEEPAPAPPAVPEPPQSAAPDEPPPAPIQEPEPVPPPQVAEPDAAPSPPEPAPQLAEPAPAPVELPKPPPPKPAVKPPKPAVKPHAVAAAPTHPPIAAPAAPQVAVMTPPAAAAPVIPPRPISGFASNRKPDYPPAARERGQQGRVLLRVEVSAAGAPLSVTVISSSGHPILDQAALRAVEQWRFNPATQAGMPVSGAAEVPVQFRLED